MNTGDFGFGNGLELGIADFLSSQTNCLFLLETISSGSRRGYAVDEQVSRP
jgi:hypothetical protein